MDKEIGHADHLSRDNRLDLSDVPAYRRANEMDVTLKRHMQRLRSSSIKFDLRRREKLNTIGGKHDK
jgi:hypothetical protein